MEKIIDNSLDQIKNSASTSFSTVSDKLQKLEQNLVEQSNRASLASSQYIHANPFKALFAASAVGVLIGLLLASSRH